jgi:hypothetical protein
LIYLSLKQLKKKNFIIQTRKFDNYYNNKKINLDKSLNKQTLIKSLNLNLFKY